MIDDKDLMIQRLSLLVGCMIGQIAELLNNVKDMSNPAIYKSLFDIDAAASLHANEIFYKGNKRESNV